MTKTSLAGSIEAMMHTLRTMNGAAFTDEEVEAAVMQVINSHKSKNTNKNDTRKEKS